jgi:ubiquinone/menaquinone biosynthesis C-methylase UbiE
VTAVDISSGMHERAIERLHRHRAHKIRLRRGRRAGERAAQRERRLRRSRPSGSRPSIEAQHERLAALVARVLKPGGVFAMIEASDPKGWALRPLYLFHLRRVLPVVERLFLRGAQDFAMIGTYSMNFGDASGVAAMLRRHGLETRYTRFFFGCATAVSGRKPLPGGEGESE